MADDSDNKPTFSTKTLVNNTGGPKIVNARTGGVTLQPGESADVEISDAEHAALQAVDFLGGSKAGSVPDANQDASVKQLMDAHTKDQLVEIAAREDVPVDEGAKKEDIANAIVHKRSTAA